MIKETRESRRLSVEMVDDKMGWRDNKRGWDPAFRYTKQYVPSLHRWPGRRPRSAGTDSANVWAWEGAASSLVWCLADLAQICCNGRGPFVGGVDR